jgi:hypothetical protein
VPPLRAALEVETISDHLMQGNKTSTQKDQQQNEQPKHQQNYFVYNPSNV